MTTKTIRFMTVLADDSTPVPISTIAYRSGLTVKDCGRISSRLVSQKRISRTKPSLSKGGGYYRYFLTDDQLKGYYRRLGTGWFDSLSDISAIDAVDRLILLRMLRERTAYGQNPVLAAIIDDYERALAIARNREVEHE